MIHKKRTKEEYKQEGLRRTKLRKDARKVKRKKKKRTRLCPCCGHYPEDDYY